MFLQSLNVVISLSVALLFFFPVGKASNIGSWMNLGERYEIPYRNTYDPLNAKTHTHLLRASNEEPRAETKSAVGRDVSVYNVTGGSVLESLN